MMDTHCADRTSADEAGASSQGLDIASATRVPAVGRPKLCVVIASRGRPKTLAKAVRLLESQTRRPDYVLVSATTIDDVDSLEQRPWLEIIVGKAGLASQRNAAMRRMPNDVAYVVFFDDDFVAHPRWIEVVERCFEQRPRVVAVTGHIAADGVKGPGLSLEEGLEAINSYSNNMSDYLIEGFSPYGCNMAFRWEAISGLSFDERLVLYGWLEDRDFGGSLAKRGGKLIKLGRAVGVHLGTKTGRMSGRRLGYSQVVNPIYLHRKGTMTTSSLIDHVFRNIMANLVRSLVPEPHIDRFGRFIGNVIAARDIFRGLIAPERAELL